MPLPTVPPLIRQVSPANVQATTSALQLLKNIPEPSSLRPSRNSQPTKDGAPFSQYAPAPATAWPSRNKQLVTLSELPRARIPPPNYTPGARPRTAMNPLISVWASQPGQSNTRLLPLASIVAQVGSPVALAKVTPDFIRIPDS